MPPSYYDIDDILAEDEVWDLLQTVVFLLHAGFCALQRIPCEFKITAFDLGYLDERSDEEDVSRLGGVALRN